MMPQKTDNAPKVSANKGATLSTLHHLWPYMWPSSRPDLKQRVVIAMVVLIFAKIATVLVPYAYKWATDALIVPGTPISTRDLLLATPIVLIAAYGLGRILINAFTQLRDALFASVGQHAVRRLSYLTFVHMHNLSLRFHLQRRTGGLARVISRGINGIESVVRYTILMSIPTAVEFVLSASVITYQFDWTYLLVVALTVIAYVWFSVKASDWRISIRRTMNESDTDANSKAIDSLLNFETVKYFGNETMEADRFDRSMARYEKAAIRTWTSLAWLNIGQTVIFITGSTICMIMSGMAVMRGQQSLGDFVLINALLLNLSIPLNFIGAVYREIKQGLTDIEAMFSLLEIPPEVLDKPNAPALKVNQAHVRFENVAFHYDPEREILKGLSFDVPPGHTVAIVGPSGAGKSTLSRLLFRFYDVSGGRITIDDQDIRDVSQLSLRAAIGMVPQDTVLFNDTIGYNIAYGRFGASREEVVRAARAAQIATFIESLPNGYDTEVGERGLKLSGGEKQRVAIARTILKAPSILILDEATSALDSHTERDIQEALDLVSANRTTLVIAHRLSTVINANQILVLEAGKIVERGSHSELLAKNGLYASMWNRQQEAAEAAERLRLAGGNEAAEMLRMIAAKQKEGAS